MFVKCTYWEDTDAEFILNYKNGNIIPKNDWDEYLIKNCNLNNDKLKSKVLSNNDFHELLEMKNSNVTNLANKFTSNEILHFQKLDILDLNTEKESEFINYLAKNDFNNKNYKDILDDAKKYNINNNELDSLIKRGYIDVLKENEKEFLIHFSTFKMNKEDSIDYINKNLTNEKYDIEKLKSISLINKRLLFLNDSELKYLDKILNNENKFKVEKYAKENSIPKSRRELIESISKSKKINSSNILINEFTKINTSGFKVKYYADVNSIDNRKNTSIYGSFKKYEYKNEDSVLLKKHLNNEDLSNLEKMKLLSSSIYEIKKGFIENIDSKTLYLYRLQNFEDLKDKKTDNIDLLNKILATEPKFEDIVNKKILSYKEIDVLKENKNINLSELEKKATEHNIDFKNLLKNIDIITDEDKNDLKLINDFILKNEKEGHIITYESIKNELAKSTEIIEYLKIYQSIDNMYKRGLVSLIRENEIEFINEFNKNKIHRDDKLSDLLENYAISEDKYNQFISKGFIKEIPEEYKEHKELFLKNNVDLKEVAAKIEIKEENKKIISLLMKDYQVPKNEINLEKDYNLRYREIKAENEHEIVSNKETAQYVIEKFKDIDLYRKKEAGEVLSQYESDKIKNVEIALTHFPELKEILEEKKLAWNEKLFIGELKKQGLSEIDNLSKEFKITAERIEHFKDLKIIDILSKEEIESLSNIKDKLKSHSLENESLESIRLNLNKEELKTFESLRTRGFINVFKDNELKFIKKFNKYTTTSKNEIEVLKLINEISEEKYNQFISKGFIKVVPEEYKEHKDLFLKNNVDLKEVAAKIEINEENKKVISLLIKDYQIPSNEINLEKNYNLRYRSIKAEDEHEIVNNKETASYVVEKFKDIDLYRKKEAGEVLSQYESDKIKNVEIALTQFPELKEILEEKKLKWNEKLFIGELKKQGISEIENLSKEFKITDERIQHFKDLKIIDILTKEEIESLSSLKEKLKDQGLENSSIESIRLNLNKEEIKTFESMRTRGFITVFKENELDFIKEFNKEASTSKNELEIMKLKYNINNSKLLIFNNLNYIIIKSEDEINFLNDIKKNENAPIKELLDKHNISFNRSQEIYKDTKKEYSLDVLNSENIIKYKDYKNEWIIDKNNGNLKDFYEHKFNYKYNDISVLKSSDSKNEIKKYILNESINFEENKERFLKTIGTKKIYQYSKDILEDKKLENFLDNFIGKDYFKDNFKIDNYHLFIMKDILEKKTDLEIAEKYSITASEIIIIKDELSKKGYMSFLSKDEKEILEKVKLDIEERIDKYGQLSIDLSLEYKNIEKLVGNKTNHIHIDVLKQEEILFLEIAKNFNNYDFDSKDIKNDELVKKKVLCDIEKMAFYDYKNINVNKLVNKNCIEVITGEKLSYLKEISSNNMLSNDEKNFLMDKYDINYYEAKKLDKTLIFIKKNKINLDKNYLVVTNEGIGVYVQDNIALFKEPSNEILLRDKCEISIKNEINKKDFKVFLKNKMGEDLSFNEAVRLKELECTGFNFDFKDIPSNQELIAFNQLLSRKLDKEKLIKYSSDFQIDKDRIEFLIQNSILKYSKEKEKYELNYEEPKSLQNFRNYSAAKNKNVPFVFLQKIKVSENLLNNHEIKDIMANKANIKSFKLKSTDFNLYYKIKNNESLTYFEHKRIKDFQLAGIMYEGKLMEKTLFDPELKGSRLIAERKKELLDNFLKENNFNREKINDILLFINTFKQVSKDNLIKNNALSEDEINTLVKNKIIDQHSSKKTGKYYSIQHIGELSGRTFLEEVIDKKNIQKTIQNREDLIFHDLKVVDCFLKVKEEYENNGYFVKKIMNETSQYSENKRNVQNDMRKSEAPYMDCIVEFEKKLTIQLDSENEIKSSSGSSSETITVAIEFGDYKLSTMSKKVESAKYDVAEVFSSQKNLVEKYINSIKISRQVRYRTI
ncbi:MAG: hypothetical protein K2X69_06290 [Silvanigrellaceae bacterium]|nr:hypothetical protein [Silvanigrellaceae bacterium]